MGQILLNEKNLLVITPGFPDKNNKNILGIFVKDQVNAIKNEFKEIYVIAPILRTLKFFSRERYCHNYTYDNVSVFYPRCFYVPLIYSFGKKIDNRLRVVLNTIKRNNLSFDLVHAHFTWPSGYIGQQIKEKFNTPYILTVHENRNWFQKELDKEYKEYINAWKNAALILRVNMKDYELLKKYNPEVYYQPNSVSGIFEFTEKISARKQIGLQEDAKIIFAFGNHLKSKGFHDLIEAMKIILESGNKMIHCYIGGSGIYSSEMRRLIRKYNLLDNVKMIGPINRNEIVNWFNAADFYIMPSHHESFGITVIEALSSGVPVITTYNGASEFIIENDNLGLLVNPKSPKKLAEAIEEAFQRKWDSKFITKFVTKYSEKAFCKNLTNYFRKIVK